MSSVTAAGKSRGRADVAGKPAVRTLFVLPAGLALVVGVDAGLTLLRAWPPVNSARLGDLHGILMVVGFIGTLIALERAVAWRRPVGYLAPALLGAGALLLIVPTAPLVAQIGATLLPAGAAALCLVYLPLWRRQRDDAVLISALGAVCLLGGALLWRGGVDLPLVLPWLAGFVILTIAGERLELARLAMPRTAGRDLVVLAAGQAVSVTAATLWPRPGQLLWGVTLLALAMWLARYDVARRTVGSTGLPRFAAVCMLAGQFWLAVAGAVLVLAGSISGGPVVEGPAYDALVHAVFLGFALSMIFAHAPTILPAVTKARLPYRPAMWLPWVVLQASLALRLWGGDALGDDLLRRLGGAGNAVALLAFVLVSLGTAVAASRDSRGRQSVAGAERSATARLSGGRR